MTRDLQTTVVERETGLETSIFRATMLVIPEAPTCQLIAASFLVLGYGHMASQLVVATCLNGELRNIVLGGGYG